MLMWKEEFVLRDSNAKREQRAKYLWPKHVTVLSRISFGGVDEGGLCDVAAEPSKIKVNINSTCVLTINV
jgi:hypothetical protein